MRETKLGCKTGAGCEFPQPAKFSKHVKFFFFNFFFIFERENFFLNNNNNNNISLKDEIRNNAAKITIVVRIFAGCENSQLANLIRNLRKFAGYEISTFLSSAQKIK